MNQVTDDFKQRFSNRVWVSVLLLMVVIPVVLFGGIWIIIFSLIGLMFVTHEILTVRPGHVYPLAIRLFVYLMMVSLIFFVFIRNNFFAVGFEFSQWSLTTGLESLELSTVLLTILVSTLFFSSITDMRFKVQDATYLITMVVLLSLSVQGFLFLRFFPNFIFMQTAISRPEWANGLLLLYVGIATFATDIGAYLVGTFFGQHKMNVRVSKNKTWEGFFGGLLFSFVFSFTFAMVMDAIGLPILPFLTQAQWYWLVFLSIVMPLIATLGDFTFSIIKREFQIKNFSNLLGEHGGVLDRIDSFSMVCLVAALFITVIFELFYLVR